MWFRTWVQRWWFGTCGQQTPGLLHPKQKCLHRVYNRIYVNPIHAKLYWLSWFLSFQIQIFRIKVDIKICRCQLKYLSQMETHTRNISNSLVNSSRGTHIIYTYIYIYTEHMTHLIIIWLFAVVFFRSPRLVKMDVENSLVVVQCCDPIRTNYFRILWKSRLVECYNSPRMGRMFPTRCK